MTQQKSSDVIYVDITSAAALTGREKQTICRLLSQALNVKNVVLQEKTDESLIGGFQIQMASCLIDLSVKRKLKQITDILSRSSIQRKDLNHIPEFMMQIKQSGVLNAHVENIGRIASVKDGIVRVLGMKQVKAGELICFEDNVFGIVLNINIDFCDVVLLMQSKTLNEGDIAIQTGNVLKVPVGKALVGRVVNALGQPIDDKGKIETKQFMPTEAVAPGIVDRVPVKTPFQTGIKVIDALIPIGLGQRELIIGDRQTGKTSLLIDAILNQKKENAHRLAKDKIYCVYVAIGQKQSSVADVVRVLEENGAMDYTCVVCATASDTAAQQYIAPFTATTIAEYFRDKGMNAIVFYDDLSKHADAYRQLSLLLRRPAGREAYPGDIFYLHSRLLERAAAMNEKNGGGSLTAIPVVETQEGDVSAYIPTNVISITDGQIFLESTLFHQGIRPAVNIGLSVSRVGSKAQFPLIAGLSGSMKLELSQYREMLSFAQIASDLDISAQALLQKGVRLTECLKQNVHSPLTPIDEFLCLYIVKKGFYDNVNLESIRLFEDKILQYLHENYSDVIEKINLMAKELSFDLAKQLDEAIKEALTFCMLQKEDK